MQSTYFAVLFIKTPTYHYLLNSFTIQCCRENGNVSLYIRPNLPHHHVYSMSCIRDVNGGELHRVKSMVLKIHDNPMATNKFIVQGLGFQISSMKA